MNVAVERLSGLQKHTVRHRQLLGIDSPWLDPFVRTFTLN